MLEKNKILFLSKKMLILLLISYTFSCANGDSLVKKSVLITNEYIDDGLIYENGAIGRRVDSPKSKFTVIFWRNGFYSKGRFINEKKEKKWTTYRPNGIVHSERQFAQNMLYHSVFYNESGEVISEDNTPLTW